METFDIESSTVSSRIPLPTRLILAVVLAAAVCSLISPSSSQAADTYPCGSTMKVAWSTELVQPCTLYGPLAPNNWVPVYTAPVPNPRGSTPPAPASWLRGLDNQIFVCEREFTSAVYYHPSGYRNYWWGYTLSDDGVWGWVPEVFFRGGLDDEPDGGSPAAGLRPCPPEPVTVAPPPTTTTPACTTSCPGEPVSVPPPPKTSPCAPSTEKSSLRLTAAFPSHRKRVVARFDRRVRVRGRLIDAAGKPLVDQKICVGQIDPSAGALRKSGTTSTDAEGRFSYRLGKGVSRRIWFVYRTSAGVASTSVLLLVRSPASLRAEPAVLHNGQTVVLHGRIGGGRAAEGVLIEVQARRGTRFQTFGTTRVGERGQFKYRYRFTRTYGVQRYALRIRVPRQRGYPYASGSTRPVQVTVRE